MFCPVEKLQKLKYKNIGTERYKLSKLTFIPKAESSCLKTGLGNNYKNVQIFLILPESVKSSQCFIDVRYIDNAMLYDVRFTNNSQGIILPTYLAPSTVDLYCNSTLDKEGGEDISVMLGVHGEFSIRKDCRRLKGSISHSYQKPVKNIKRTEENFLVREKKVHSKLTLCTQLSVDRLFRLEYLTKMYGGPISAAVYISSDAEKHYLLDYWNQSDYLQAYASIHIVYEDWVVPFDVGYKPSGKVFLYPLNFLRNIAVQNADTEWILYIEADMVTQKNLSFIATKAIETVLAPDKYKRNTAFILPLFYPQDNRRLSQNIVIPQHKNELAQMGFQKPFYRSHSYMNYEKWLESNSTTTLGVYNYDATPSMLKLMEPYYMAKKNAILMYDSNIYCFLDKVSQVYSMASCLKTKFVVMENLFLMNFESGLKDDFHGPSRFADSVCNKFSAHFRGWEQFDNYDIYKFSFFPSSQNNAIDTKWINNQNWHKQNVLHLPQFQSLAFILLMPVILAFLFIVSYKMRLMKI
jgi:hypothetical protein